MKPQHGLAYTVMTFHIIYIYLHRLTPLTSCDLDHITTTFKYSPRDGPMNSGGNAQQEDQAEASYQEVGHMYHLLTSLNQKCKHPIDQTL